MSGCPNVGRMCNCTGACLRDSESIVAALVGTMPGGVMSVQAELDAVTVERDNLVLERDGLLEQVSGLRDVLDERNAVISRQASDLALLRRRLDAVRSGGGWPL